MSAKSACFYYVSAQVSKRASVRRSSPACSMRRRPFGSMDGSAVFIKHHVCKSEKQYANHAVHSGKVYPLNLAQGSEVFSAASEYVEKEYGYSIEISRL